jgi:hypothetical protein
MPEKLSPRVVELLEESRLKLLAEEEAARLGIEGGETLSGGLALEAARARLVEQGVDPDNCTEDELAKALAAVGEIEGDVTIVPPEAPVEPEPVVGVDVVREAKRLLRARGLVLDQGNFALALDIIERRSR